MSQSHCPFCCCKSVCSLALSVLPLEAARRVFVHLLRDHHRRARPIVRRHRRLVRGRRRHRRRLRARARRGRPRPCGGAVGRRGARAGGGAGLLLAQLPAPLLDPQLVAVLVPRQVGRRHSRWDSGLKLLCVRTPSNTFSEIVGSSAGTHLEKL